MAELNGWIKIHRRMLHSSFYKNLTGKQRDVIITILLMADSEEKEWMYKGKIYKTSPGQVFSSLNNIAKLCGRDCTRETVRTTITNAQRNGFLTIETHKTHTLITIENWGKYQSDSLKTTQDTPTTNTKQNCGYTPNKKKEERNIYSSNSIEFELSKLLFDLLKGNNPKIKEPNLQEWAKHIDLMIRIDKREPTDIEKVIKFAQRDDFWWNNIKSTSKLRKQFDTLYPKAMDIKPKSRSVGLGGENGWERY